MIYIVVKEKDSDPRTEQFDFGVAFTKENMKNIEWLYFAKSKSDADTALNNLPEEYNIDAALTAEESRKLASK